MAAKHTVIVADSLDSVERGEWNSLNPNQNPFLDYDFLNNLERYECLQQQAWFPCHHLLYENQKLIAAIPLYIKQDSYGEFVFDWAWADAFERMGKDYYPKLVSAIPFTPVIGDRLLIKSGTKESGQLLNKLLQALKQFVEDKQMSSIHLLFCRANDQSVSARNGFLKRISWQYHWHNRSYKQFDDFLLALNSKRRKQIRKERRQVNELGIEIQRLCGSDIKEDHWQSFYQFYCSTFQRKWGEPRFTLPFFLSLMDNLSKNCLLVMAKRQDQYIAGAFAMQSADSLYGRHWGCSEYHPLLHFELCYYQTIEYCIEKGLQRLDAGVQGEHKIFRGFEPVKTCSMHWIADSGFRQSVENFLFRETAMIEEQIYLLKQHIPYTLEDNA